MAPWGFQPAASASGRGGRSRSPAGAEMAGVRVANGAHEIRGGRRSAAAIGCWRALAVFSVPCICTVPKHGPDPCRARFSGGR